MNKAKELLKFLLFCTGIVILVQTVLFLSKPNVISWVSGVFGDSRLTMLAVATIPVFALIQLDSILSVINSRDAIKFSETPAETIRIIQAHQLSMLKYTMLLCKCFVCLIAAYFIMDWYNISKTNEVLTSFQLLIAIFMILGIAAAAINNMKFKAFNNAKGIFVNSPDTYKFY